MKPKLTTTHSVKRVKVAPAVREFLEKVAAAGSGGPVTPEAIRHFVLAEAGVGFDPDRLYMLEVWEVPLDGTASLEDAVAAFRHENARPLVQEFGVDWMDLAGLLPECDPREAVANAPEEEDE